MPSDGALERKLKREIAARKEAERLLEQKGVELYESNQQLRVAIGQLELQTQYDLRKFEFEQQIDECLIHFGRAFLSQTLDDALIINFMQQLTVSDVVESSYVRFVDLDLETMSLTEFGDKSNVSLSQIAEKTLWREDHLFIPLKVEGELVGELVFGVRIGDVAQDFIASQMSLVAELLCSAISRQRMLSATLKAKKRAEESERATKEFVAMINHELRTPLTGLLGSADLLKETPLSKEQSDYLANLNQSGEFLRTIINDLLDFSKMNAGMMELFLTEFSWQELESSLTGIFSHKAREQQIQFTITRKSDVPDRFIGDFERITQIMVNLIGNAIKFTSEGSVDVLVKWKNERLVTVISDTGVGIGKEAQATLFDPFVQADRSSKRNYEGTGLGLAICKNLITLMDGEIALKSDLGKGTQFTVSLPLPTVESDVAEEAVEQVVDEQKSFDSLSILVVDDIRMNQIIITQMLKKLQVKPDIGNNGREAVDAVEANHYDLIFMDCRMPEMDGFEATRHLRDQGLKTPIIALTAGTTLAERELCIESGMDDILTKPYTASDLESMLTKWM